LLSQAAFARVLLAQEKLCQWDPQRAAPALPAQFKGPRQPRAQHRQTTRLASAILQRDPACSPTQHLQPRDAALASAAWRSSTSPLRSTETEWGLQAPPLLPRGRAAQGQDPPAPHFSRQSESHPECSLHLAQAHGASPPHWLGFAYTYFSQGCTTFFHRRVLLWSEAQLKPHSTLASLTLSPRHVGADAVGSSSLSSRGSPRPSTASGPGVVVGRGGLVKLAPPGPARWRFLRFRLPHTAPAPTHLAGRPRRRRHTTPEATFRRRSGVRLRLPAPPLALHFRHGRETTDRFDLSVPILDSWRCFLPWAHLS
jgi:hypothetical protein